LDGKTKKKHIRLTFKEVIEQKEPRFIGRGLYYQQLKVYRELFQPEQIMILFYEEVFKNPEYWLAQICRFLGIDDKSYLNNSTVNEKVFPASGYKSTTLLNLQNKVVNGLRRNRFSSQLLTWLKNKGISDRLKKLNTIKKYYDTIDEKDAMSLYNFYKEDMQALSFFLNKELPFETPFKFHEVCK